MLVLQLGAAPAYAAGPERADAAVSTSPDPTRHPPSSSAQELADRAYELHAAGEYAAAIATYLRAYDASNAGVTLLNIATIYDRKLHEPALAAEYYRRYLRAPDAEPSLVQKATERLTALKQAEANAAEPAQPIALQPTPLQPSGSTPAAADVPAVAGEGSAHESGLRTAGLLVIVTGATTLGASLVLGLLAKGKNDDANAMCDGAACMSDEGVRLAHQASTLATASTITFITSLGLAGGGLAMIFLAPRTSNPSAARLALAPTLDARSAQLALWGEF
ncbi:MAG TPA: hypothetical protein VK762_08060 [Polyangiaceae bacterium]|nr:hypothetical protein [Polyangiaceae bacterium]